MVNFIAGAIMMFFLLVTMCALRGGSDADDHWEELMEEAREADYDVH